MIITGLAILGLCLGSFVNALVYRLRWQETHPKEARKRKELYSISHGRSICPNCGNKLSAMDLVPVLSWIFLKGKCRYCKKSISWQYPAVELITAGLFVVSYSYWPQDLSNIGNVIEFIVWLICLTGFVALFVYDIRYLILPNRIIFPLLALAVFSSIIQSLAASDSGAIISAMLGAVVGGGLFYILFQVSKGSWIGGGDVKLGFLLGILLGSAPAALLMLFLASLLGTIYSLPLIITGKVRAKSRIPFGPFLIIAAIVVQLFGTDMTDWYLSLTDPSY